MNKFRNFFSALVIGLLFFTACGPATNITATWSNPEITATGYDNVLVTAMVNNVPARQMLESEITAHLRTEGVNATRAMDLFPPELRDEKMGSKEELMNAIEEKQFDGILTVTLIDAETETRYVPGNYMYAPINRFGYYGTFWGYYNYWYPLAYDPGYYAETKTYFLETNLYDAETEKLVWSAQSETVNPGSLANFSEDFSQRIVEKLTNENLVSTTGMAVK